MLALAQQYPFAFQVLSTFFFYKLAFLKMFIFSSGPNWLCNRTWRQMAISTIKTSAADLIAQVGVEKKGFWEV
jgi:hypothetical protein